MALPRGGGRGGRGGRGGFGGRGRGRGAPRQHYGSSASSRPAPAGSKTDRVAAAAKEEKKVNPFDMRVNRKKFDILGRKVKGERGNVAESRAKGVEARKKTLLVEFEQRGKTNAFIDRRFGENDASMSVEDKMMKRFARERQKQSRFSLADDDDDDAGDGRLGDSEEEELTHLGKPIKNIDDFDEKDLRLDSDEDEPMDAQAVADFHFGGGLRPKRAREEDESGGEDEGERRPKSRKEIMEEVIAKSKMHKLERQREKERVEDEMDRVDAMFDGIRGLLKRRDEEEGPVVDTSVDPRIALMAQADKRDEYDATVKELAYDMRAKPTDRLKTAEEIAAEERERLAKLEADRLRRMRGVADDGAGGASRSARGANGKPNEESADGLDENFVLDDDRVEIAYKDGRLVTPVGDAKRKRTDFDTAVSGDHIGSDDEGGESASGEEESGDSGDEEGDEDEGDSEDEDASDLELGSGEEGSDEGGDMSGVEEDDSEESGSEDEQEEVSKRSKSAGDKSRRGRAQTTDPVALKRIAEMKEAAAKELPYTFDVPKDVEQFRGYFEGRPDADQVIVVKRILTCNALSLAAANRGKLSSFIGVLLDHIALLAGAREGPFPSRLISAHWRFVHELAAKLPQAAVEHAQAQLRTMAENLDRDVKGGKKSGFPPCASLVLLSGFATLFPASDFRHPVTTPTALLVARYLSQCHVKTAYDVAAGLVLCDIAKRFVSQSKRFFPEAVSFLTGVVALALRQPLAGLKQLSRQIAPNFHETDAAKGLPLPHVEHKGVTHSGGSAPNGAADSDKKRKSKWKGRSAEDSKGPTEQTAVPQLNFRRAVFAADEAYLSSEEFGAACMAMAASLATAFAGLYRELDCFGEIFETLRLYLGDVCEARSVPSVQALLETTRDAIAADTRAAVARRAPLQYQRHKPIALKMYTPKFDDTFEIGRRRDPDKERNESKKLKYKHRQEMKGAIREIRKDAAFLGAVKHKAMKEKDADRAARVKQLQAALSDQQGEANLEKKEKRKLKV